MSVKPKLKRQPMMFKDGLQMPSPTFKGGDKLTMPTKNSHHVASRGQPRHASIEARDTTPSLAMFSGPFQNTRCLQTYQSVKASTNTLWGKVSIQFNVAAQPALAARYVPYGNYRCQLCQSRQWPTPWRPVGWLATNQPKKKWDHGVDAMVPYHWKPPSNSRFSM